MVQNKITNQILLKNMRNACQNKKGQIYNETKFLSFRMVNLRKDHRERDQKKEEVLQAQLDANATAVLKATEEAAAPSKTTSAAQRKNPIASDSEYSQAAASMDSTPAMDRSSEGSSASVKDGRRAQTTGKIAPTMQPAADLNAAHEPEKAENTVKPHSFSFGGRQRREEQD